MDEEIELLIIRLSKAIEANDKETVSKINKEVDSILSKLLLDNNKQI